MPHTPTNLTDALAHIAELVKTGDIRKAKRETTRLIGTADVRTLWILEQCVRITENYPHAIARPRLEAFAHGAPTDAERALIIACIPDTDPGLYKSEPSRAPHWVGKTRQAPRRQSTRYIRKATKQEQQARRRAAQAERDAARYQAERGGVDDAPARSEYDHYDYDKFAEYPLRGTPCLSCWAERSSLDTRSHGRRYDEGLCTECREKGRAGIAPADVPADHTAADLIRARCKHITTHNPAAAHALLVTYWRHSHSPKVRATIAQWVTDNPLAPAAPAEQPATTHPDTGDINRCRHCDTTLPAPHRAEFCSTACRTDATQPEQTAQPTPRARPQCSSSTVPDDVLRNAGLTADQVTELNTQLAELDAELAQLTADEPTAPELVRPLRCQGCPDPITPAQARKGAGYCAECADITEQTPATA